MIGLWHSTVSGATLNPAMAGNPEAATLEDDDLEGLCYLYGTFGQLGEIGDYCDENRDCSAGLSCLADGNQRYCSTECADNDDCPDDFSCFSTGAGDYCVTASGCGGCQGSGPAGALAAGIAAFLLAARRRLKVVSR